MKKIKWLAALVFFTACNNESTTAKTAEEKAATGHAGHSMGSNNYCDSVNNGFIANDTLKGSPHRTAMSTVNGNHVHIEYNSPGVKGRNIWGGLVAYDKVWATGAHRATSVKFSKDVMINDKKIPAGQYAFFTIPGKEKWIVILNTRFDQHLADDYNEKEDVIRMELKPEEHAMTQRLTYTVEKVDDKSGVIGMQWEKLSVKLAFTTI